MTSNRLLIVSNRLPVAARWCGDRVELAPTTGGLATGLQPWHARSGGRWIGWPGDLSRCTRDQRAEIDRRLADRGIVPVHLTTEQVDRYYHGFANQVLWPLFHYLIDRVPVDASGWGAYTDANAAFADVVAREYQRGDTIWVHDYQLLCLPGLLRERLPDARIGFFLHIPFPSSEVFRVLPWRREVLAGLLGADLLGFHTFSYLRHFLASLLHIDGVEADIDRVHVGAGGRHVALGVFPMGVDAAHIGELAQAPDVVADVESIRREAGDRAIVLGVDRLDYTKGIPRRLQAFERVLAADPGLADRIRFIQMAVPSREEVSSYQRFKRSVEERVGRINGAYGTPGSMPVHYVERAMPLRRLVALYAAADVMMVTPLRDGMNLVAKEFAASRVDGDGVLVLSEFAGAAAELDGAMLVNPYDVDTVAASIQRALVMPAAERRARMQKLRAHVVAHDVHAWALAFLERLAATRPAASFPVPRPERNVQTVLAEIRLTNRLRLLLDYDGTLVPIACAPEQAAPDPELLRLLNELSAASGIELDIVSGRPCESLETWFGELPAALWAEHGFWHRRSPREAWRAAARIDPEWTARILPILRQFTASTPGARIELKPAAIAWHFRRAQREFGSRQAHELRMLLGELLSNQPFEVLEGRKVIEVRLRGVSKGTVAQQVAASAGADTTLIAIGDDRTDEELFRALPSSSVTIAVGRQTTRARFRVDDYRAVRQLLHSLVGGAAPNGAPAALSAVDDAALACGRPGAEPDCLAPLPGRCASSGPPPSTSTGDDGQGKLRVT
jgi:trehalose 6-phosphate synthase/phosphatase